MRGEFDAFCQRSPAISICQKQDRTEVGKWQILLQKSKIEQPKKSRESRSLDFSAAASLFNAITEVRDRFWMKRYGPSRRRA
jgi:hypothetical protein